VRELHGVTQIGYRDLDSLKHQAILFDTFHVIGFLPVGVASIPDLPSEVRADVLFLESRRIIRNVEESYVSGALLNPLFPSDLIDTFADLAGCGKSNFGTSNGTY
jgi:hypothetical protein